MYKEIVTPEELKALLSSEDEETLEVIPSSTHTLVLEIRRMGEALSRIAQQVDELNKRLEQLEEREHGLIPLHHDPLQDHEQILQASDTVPIRNREDESVIARPFTSRLEKHRRKKQRTGKWF